MYQALLVAPDGEHVFDYCSDSVNGVIEKLSDRGSEWFFYPFEFVVKCPTTNKSRIVASPAPELEGKSVGKVIAAFENTYKSCRDGKFVTDLHDFFDEVVLCFQKREAKN